MATAKRATRSEADSRTRVALGLLIFVVVASIVVWRRALGASTERQIGVLESERRSLASARALLENELREATSRRRIVAEAERRLGMHVATDAQTRNLADTVVTQ